MELTWTALGMTLAFVVSGLILMFIGLVVFDLVAPLDLIKEVEHGNEAAGWMVTGFLISTGIVMGQAFRANAGLLQAVIHGVIGIALNYIGYFIWEVATPKWSLSDAIKRGSLAAGKVLFGIFVATALMVAGAF